MSERSIKLEVITCRRLLARLRLALKIRGDAKMWLRRCGNIVLDEDRCISTRVKVNTRTGSYTYDCDVVLDDDVKLYLSDCDGKITMERSTKELRQCYGLIWTHTGDLAQTY